MQIYEIVNNEKYLDNDFMILNAVNQLISVDLPDTLNMNLHLIRKRGSMVCEVLKNPKTGDLEPLKALEQDGLNS